MKRRTDRAIAVSAVTAVAVVPTVIMMVVEAGGGSNEDGGSVPASAAMAQQDPANPNGTATGVVTPGTTSAPGCGLDLWADSKARPTSIGLDAQAPGATFGGSMTLGYR